MKDDWAAKLEGKRKLRFEHFAHEGRNVSHFEAIETNLTDASSGVGKELRAKGCKMFLQIRVD